MIACDTCDKEDIKKDRETYYCVVYKRRIYKPLPNGLTSSEPIGTTEEHYVCKQCKETGKHPLLDKDA